MSGVEISEKIGINTSNYESLADGLSKYHYDQLYNVLPPKFRKKSDKICLWLKYEIVFFENGEKQNIT